MSSLAHQLRFEQKIFWRSREAAVFIFIFPLLPVSYTHLTLPTILRV